MRSLLRWLRRIALTALALGVLVVAAALITAHTRWGREQLRQRVEAALRDAFPGGARVAALDGSILGTLTVRGVEIDGADHRPLVTAGTLRVAVALWPLVFQTARLDRVAAEDVEVWVRDQPRPLPAAPDRAGPSPWRVELPDLALHRGTVHVDRVGLVVDQLDVAGALGAAAGRTAISGVVHGRWTRDGGPLVELAANGAVVIAGGGVHSPAALVTLGGATIGGTALVLDADHPRGTIAIAATAPTIARLVPELVRAGVTPLRDVVAAIELTAGGPDTTQLTVTATVGDTALWAALRGEPARRTARCLVSATAIDLALATRGRLRGRGSAIAAFEVGPARASGALIAYLATPDLPIRHAGVALFGSLDHVTALILGRGDDALRLAAAGAGHVQRGAVVVDQARAVATARGVQLPCSRDVDAITGGAGTTPGAPAAVSPCRRVTGALAASATISGALSPGLDLVVAGIAEGTRGTVEPEAGGTGRAAFAALRSPFVMTIASAADDPGRLDVAVTGEATAAALGYDDVVVTAVRGSYAVAVTPELRLDEAHLAGAGIHRAGTLLGDLRVDLRDRGGWLDVAATARPPIAGVTLATRATVQPLSSSYRAVLADTRITLPDGGVWAGRGGSVVVSDPAVAVKRAFQLRGLTLHRGDAAIALHGDYVQRTGALTAHLTAEQLDASTIDPRARGLGRGALDLARRGGQWQVDGTLAVAGFAIARDATPVDATAHLVLARQHLALDAHATGPQLGGVDLAFEATAPRDPFDLAAWRRLDRAAIHTAAITARQAALRGLAGAVGSTADVPAGTIDGTVDLAPGALRGGFAVRGVALPVGDDGEGAVEGDVSFAPIDGDLGAHTTARLVGVAAADATLRFAVPQHPLDPATWRHRGRDLVREAAADIDDVAFDSKVLARLGITQRLARDGIAVPYRGRISAALALGTAAGEARLSIDLNDVTGGVLAAPVSQHLEITAGSSGSHVHAELRRGALGLGVLDGDVPMTIDRWLDEPAAVLRAPVIARWTLPATPAAPLLAIVGRHELTAGALEGSAMIGGTVAAPIVSDARFVARDLAVATPLGGRPAPVLRELAVAATWDGASGTMTVHGSEDSGGEIAATVRGRPDALGDVTGTARLKQLDIAPIAVFLPGALVSAAGKLDGDLVLHPGTRLTGKLHIADGALPLAATIGTLREATADLESDGRTITAALQGRLGRGAIRLHATAPADDPTSLSAELGLDGISPIAALRPVIRANLKATLARRDGQLHGKVTVEPGGSVTLTGRTGRPLLDAFVPSDLVFDGAPARRKAQAPTRSWLVLDIQPGAIRVAARELTEGVGLTATMLWPPEDTVAQEWTPRCGRLDRLTVSIGDTIGVCGKIRIQSDDIDVLGRRYIVESTASGSSGLVFSGSLEPALELHMSHQFPALLLGVDLRGQVSNLERPQFSSDPGGYSQDQLFAFFLGSEPGGDASSPARDQARDAFASAGANLLFRKLGRRFTRVLPIELDTLSCEPAPAAAATSAISGSCTLGKWLSPRLFLSYRQRFQPRADENTGDVDLQLRLSDKLLLDGTGGDRGYYGADLLWRHRW